MSSDDDWRSDYPWQDMHLDEDFDTIIECLGPAGERVVQLDVTPMGLRFATRGENGRTLSKVQLDRFIEELKQISDQLEKQAPAGKGL